MTNYNIVFLDSNTLPAGSFELEFNFPHHLTAYPHTTPEQVMERCLPADIVITNKVVLRAPQLKQLKKLKLIAITATGTDNIDVAAAAELGIKVANVGAYSGVSVPEHTFALMLALRRNLMAWYNDQQQGLWAQSKDFCYHSYPLNDLAATTLGIIGKGRLGSRVAELATAFGMQVIFAERPNAQNCRDGYLPFKQVMQQADIITLHCPLTEQTSKIINSQSLSWCKPSAILINVGRGGLVDEAALLQALANKQLAGAGLDVLSCEPPSAEHILIQAAKTMSNLIITPHIAWVSPSSLKTLRQQTQKNINDFIAGLTN